GLRQIRQHLMFLVHEGKPINRRRRSTPPQTTCVGRGFPRKSTGRTEWPKAVRCSRMARRCSPAPRQRRGSDNRGRQRRWGQRKAPGGRRKPGRDGGQGQKSTTEQNSGKRR